MTETMRRVNALGDLLARDCPLQELFLAIRETEGKMSELEPECGPTPMRWTARRKLEILKRFQAGEITQAELDAELITADELATWRRAYEQDGLHGLKSTYLQFYRRPLKDKSNV